MAQVIVTLCDLCEDGARGEPVVVTLGEKGPTRVVDLCDTHQQALIEPVRELLVDHGRRLPDVGRVRPTAPTAVASTDGTPFPCIVCDYEGPSSGALAQHQRKHGMRSTVAAYGSLQCYVCAETFEDAHGLGGHSRAHGEEGAHGLYRQALALGDPHDLIAKRVAELGVDPGGQQRGA